jgi:hypothetical protein
MDALGDQQRGHPVGEAIKSNRLKEIRTRQHNGSLPVPRQAITPREMFRLVALVAVRTQNMPLIIKAAEAWAPYEIPRLASEVHRVIADDSQRDVEEIRRELADLDRASL